MKLDSNYRMHFAMSVTSFAMLGLLAAAPAMAQSVSEPAPSQSDKDRPSASAPGSGVEEIVVTAQRRSENLQKVPITIQSFSAQRLDSAGIKSTVDLARVTPGLYYGRGVALGSPFLRGVGTGSNGPGVENTIAVYVDGVYYASKATAITDLENVDRVEVLKGPQGTLFGRNASGGLIQIITKDPTPTPDLRLRVGYGAYDTITAAGFGNTKIAENLAANISGSYSNQGKGWGKNLGTGNDVNSTDKFNVRSKLKWTPYDATAVTLTGDYAYFKSSVGASTRPANGLKPAQGSFFTGGKYDVNDDVDPLFKSRSGGVSLKIEQDLSFAKFVSTTAWRGDKYSFLLDGDTTPNRYLVTNFDVHEDQYSQEFQLSGGSASTLQWTSGVYLFSYSGTQLGINRGSIFPTLQYSGMNGRQRSESVAVYGQATKELLAHTRLTLGGRYTWETRKLDGYNLSASLAGVVTAAPIADRQTSFQKPTWRIALEQDLAPDVLAYVSYNRGFKSGIYNTGNLANPVVRPEIVDAYEVGLKSTLLEHKVRFNAASFYYNFRDIQLSSFGFANVQILRNAARAEIYGIDADLEVVPTEALRISGSAEWLHARYTSFPGAPVATPLITGGNSIGIGDASGNDLIRAPRFSANAAVTYTVPVRDGSVDANINYTYTAKSYQEVDNYVFVPPLNLINAQLSWAINPSYKLSVWGRNLTNKFYFQNLGAAGVATNGSAADPRTYGVTIEARF